MATFRPMTANRLGTARSSYLRSAAHQPIHWFPWGEEAFAAARSADQPVLLDIGAVWCHWCHVMDGESYEDSTSGRVPQRALRLHQGGSRRAARRRRPLPATRSRRSPVRVAGRSPPSSRPPAKCSTAGPTSRPTAKYGRPGFRTVLAGVLDAYRSRRDQVTAQARRHPAGPRCRSRREPRPGEASSALLDGAERQIASVFDPDPRRVRQPAQVPPSGRDHASCCTGGTTQPDAEIRRDHRPDARGDGAGRHLRPARRRLPPLQRGRRVDRAPLREDVLRQLGAAQGLSRRVRASSAPRSTPTWPGESSAGCGR